jgi:AraC-like DNA-binding protein
MVPTAEDSPRSAWALRWLDQTTQDEQKLVCATHAADLTNSSHVPMLSMRCRGNGNCGVGKSFAQKKFRVLGWKPLAEVAALCGFCDQAAFTRAFCKAERMAPSRW